MMYKFNPLAAAIIFISSSISLVNAAPPTKTINGDTVTYEGGSTTSSIIEAATPNQLPQQTNKLQIKGVEIDTNATTMNWNAGVSLAGNNGGETATQQYGDITLSVDKDSSVKVTGVGEVGGLYARTDSPNAVNTINNAGTVNVTSTGTADRTIGVLAENLNLGGQGAGSGKVIVNLQAGSKLTTTGDNNVYGVLASGRNTDITTDTNSSITLNDTALTSSMTGIYASTTVASSNSKVTNNGSISINGSHSSGTKTGIRANASNLVDVNNNGAITINGDNGIAINATGASGSLTSTGDITVDGTNAKGIILKSSGTTVTDEQKVTVAGNITITDSANPASTSATGSYAVRLDNATQGKGTIYYDDADGTVQLDIGSNNQAIGNVSGAFVQHSTNGAEVSIDVANIKELNINGQSAIGIVANSSGGTGDTHINFGQGKMNITGDNADGISVSNTNDGGNVTIEQTGDIAIKATTTGTPTLSPNEGIWISKGNTAGDVTINSTGNIDILSNTATGIGSTGVADGSTSITFYNQDKHINLQSLGNSTAHSLVGISANSNGAGHAAQLSVSADYVKVQGEGATTALRAIAGNGADATIEVFDTNLIQASSSAGVATAIHANNTGTGIVTVFTGNVGLIRAEGNDAVAIKTQAINGDSTLTIDNSKVQGGSGAGAGVYMTSNSGIQTLINNGELGSDNDQAIYSANTSGATLINNTNKVTGYVTLTGNDIAFNNELGGLFELQNFNGGTKQQSISNFGGNNSSFDNQGTIKFADKNNDGTLTHASFNGLASFNHGGIIDLTNGQHSKAGNTLTISNGGTGNFISNGGALYVNTRVSPNGISDKLIVDNAITGAGGATLVYITPTPNSIYGNLGPTGIEVVQVNGTSSADAFKLGKPVMNGVYGYGLFQGSPSGSASWYLRNYGLNPVVGGYLANQTAATEMFNQQLRDRLLAMPAVAQQDTSQLNTLWMRTKMSHGSRRSVNNSISNRDRLYMVQLGSDIGVWQVNGGNLHVGLMAGYGDYKNTSTDRTNRGKADSTVKGYNAGAYATWFANEDANQGLYVDTWSQYGWFRNDTKGKDVSGSKKYNSNVWSTSVETGYGIALGKTDNLQWIATPQAQLTYHYYQADNLHDKTNNLYVRDSQGSGLTSRVGIRLQAKDIQQKQPLEPFVEVNWISSNAKNNIEFNGVELSDGMPHNRYEAKVGLQGNITSKLSVSAQVGGLWGDNNYSEYQGQLNLNYKF